MPTIVKLTLAEDVERADGPDLIAEPEEIDLDELTPRARTLAEAIALTPLRMRKGILLAHGEPGQDPPEVRSWSGWASRPADSQVGPIAYLESEALKLPRGWHVYGPAIDEPVPSLAAGAGDEHLGPSGVLEYLRERDVAMTAAGWDTLRGTGHLPPDRYVCGRPQWRVTTVDAYIRRDVELWPISQVAEYLGYGGTSASAASSARKQLHRWGLVPERRAPGRGGESLYASDQIIAAHTHRPGRGVGGGRPRSS